ncbi:MAG TPA: hypothetical protein VHP36_08820 [Chitinispirillaceae bacterium]|nr:hypothetical protein [Chitinispirillaceae bacterium]
MLRRIVTLVSVGLVLSVNANQDKLDKIQKTLDNIMAKAGISIGGEFRSQYLSSTISGDSVKSTDRKTETNEYTSVDFDIKARPNEAISARVMFRMHQNWQNFYSDISNPIFSRWISIDGNPLGMFRFGIGSIKEKYSPLTLWAPEIEIMYEPNIFARQRKIAMDEMFQGENYRVLQGFNFGFDAEVAPLFNEFHFGFVGARLMNTETSLGSNSQVTLYIQKADMAKYFVGSNLDLTFLKGINLGGTWIEIFDNRNSFRGSDTTADTLAQKTAILSVRPGIDIGKTFGMPELLTLKLSSEIAVSLDDTVAFDSIGVDDNNKAIKDFIYPGTIIGKAINIAGTLGINPGEAFGLELNASIIANDEKYRNIMAQSPTFTGTRILNVEADGYKKFYSPFDALYNQVFKFTPVNNTNGWQKAPYMKTSYTNSIFFQDSLRNFQNVFDPSVQLVMPFGPATPNRLGFSSNGKVSLINNGIELKGMVTVLNQMNAEVYEDFTFAKTEFSQFGGGAKIDISKMVQAIKYPMELSGSMVMSKASNGTEGNSFEITSAMTNLGLYYQFWKRMSLLGGLQIINNKASYDDFVGDQAEIRKMEVVQKMSQMSAGLEWKVSDGASVVGTIGKIKVDTDDKHLIEGSENTYEEYDWPSGQGSAPSGEDYDHFLFNLFLRVKF